MVFEEGDVFVPEGLTDEFPVFLVFFCVNKLNGIKKFHMNKANNEPDVESPFILVPSLGEFLLDLVFVSKSHRLLLLLELGMDLASILP